MGNRPNETLHRLRDWESGPPLSEQLAAQILLAEGFTDIDPSQPRGGADGGMDAVCMRSQKRWVMAAYFPHGRLAHHRVRSKLLEDAKGATKNLAHGIVFVTNQAISVAQRQKLAAEVAPLALDIFHLDRIAMILDAPKMRTVRRQFLNIDFSPPEPVSVLPSPPPRTSAPAEAAPPLFPTLGVFQPTDASSGDLAADQFFRLRIYSPAFMRLGFEPRDEDAFLARVREVFIEDAGAELEPPDSGRMLVQHAGLRRAFHRRWAWWTTGAIGMAATLTDLNRPGRYSVADVVVDVMRFVSLTCDVGGRTPGAAADLVLELDPYPLEPEFDLSDARARRRFPMTARLGGVGTVAHPTPRSTRELSVAATYALDNLKSDAVDFTAQGLVLLLRSFHGARVDSKQFAASIPEVMAASVRARTA